MVYSPATRILNKKKIIFFKYEGQITIVIGPADLKSNTKEG
jgi:hypothetical protein